MSTFAKTDYRKKITGKRVQFGLL